MSKRANALADRVEAGAKALGDYAAGLTDAQWRTPITPDGRTAGVLVNHVASVYPLEVDLARSLAQGQAIVGVTWAVVADMNAKHALDNAATPRADTLALLKKNSAEAAARVRAFSDDELDTAAGVSLNGDAPLTSQFMLEDHALRHSFHHLAKIRAVLG